MNSRKLLIYLSAIAFVLIILILAGRKAGWIGGGLTYDVAVEKVHRRDITEIITASGKIQPETEVIITPDVSGEIVELAVREGERVVQGQFLLKIKPDNYISVRDRALAAVNTARSNLASAKAMLTQAEARYEQAYQTYVRNEKLWDEKTISDSEWESALSAYRIAQADLLASQQNVAAAGFSVESAEAGLNEAQTNLTRTSVYAPMEGIITRLLVEQGERVVGTELMSGTEMLRVANLERMEIMAEVNENDIIRVKLNDSVIIEVDAYPDRRFWGSVSEIASSASTAGVAVDQVTNFQVKILIAEESYSDIRESSIHPLRPGMSASIDILTQTMYDVMAIPLQSVILMADSLKTDDNIPGGKSIDDPLEIVFLNNNGKVKSTVVQTGIQDNNYIEIVAGLKEEDEVVSAPYNVISRWLKDGATIRVVPEADLLK